jgi:4-carboxymuconolactone decarboxylase
MDEQQRRQEGMKMRRRVLGDAYVDRAVAAATDFTTDFQDLITRYAWGEIWTRPGLDLPTPRFLVIGTMIALGQWDELRLHVRAAVSEGGVAADVLKEIVLQQAIYCGVPAARTAIGVIREALDDLANRDRPARTAEDQRKQS